MAQKSPSDVRYGGAFVEMYAELNPLFKDIKDAEKKVEKKVEDVGKKASSKFASAFQKIKPKLTMGSVVAGFAAATASAQRFASVGREIQDAMRATGYSAEMLSVFRYATGDITRIRDLSKDMANFMMGLQTGSGDSVRAAQELGVSFQMLSQLSPEKRFLLLWDRIGKIRDASVRSWVAMRAMGESAVQMMPYIERGSQYLAESAAKANAFGLIFDSDRLRIADTLSLRLVDMKNAAEGLALAMGEAFGPGIIKAIEAMTSFVVQSQKTGGLKQTIKNRIINSELVSKAGLATPGAKTLGFASGLSNHSLMPYSGARKILMPNHSLMPSNTDLLFNFGKRAAVRRRLADSAESWNPASFGLGGKAPSEFSGLSNDAISALNLQRAQEEEAWRAGELQTAAAAQRQLMLRRMAATLEYQMQNQTRIETSMAAIVPQTGLNPLEQLGGIGGFRPGDIQQQQLHQQTKATRMLEQIKQLLGDKKTNAAVYA